jgi:tetratricopeptide (TPR) repeat protein
VRPRYIGLAAILFVLVMTSFAGAQPAVDGPEAHFKRGVALYQQSDFKAALVEFRRAYELSSNWKLLYNVGEAEYQTHDYTGALAAFESYLREGGDRVPRARRAEVDVEIARLRARVGRLTVRSAIPGAAVSIDDEVVGEVPITRDVAVGARHVVVTKDGYAPWSRVVELVGGDTVTLDAALERIAPAVLATPVPPAPVPVPAPAATAPGFPWPAWVVTGALTVGAVTTGILALDASSNLSAAKGRFDVSDGELHDKATRVTTFAVLTDVLAASALVSGAFSLYLTLKARHGDNGEVAPKSSAVLGVSPLLGGASAWGRF